MKTSRRRFLRTSFTAAGAALLGTGCGESWREIAERGGDPFASGEPMGDLDFIESESAPLNVPLGEGLDGRLFPDLSRLTPETLVTPNDRFFIRTRCPAGLDVDAPWGIRLHGLVEEELSISLDEILRASRPMGTHLLECSGTKLRLMSAAAWDGVPLADVLGRIRPKGATTRVLISGYDEHAQPSEHSTPGASWIFTLDEIARYRPFLATRMNGEALSRDHGRPIRLVVPGWFACSHVKWLNEIEFVDENAPSTPQMIEFAGRTGQDGEPALARDYRPAVMELSAAPVRIERWRVDGRLLYRVVGIVWGGEKPTNALEIRFNPIESYEPLHHCPLPESTTTWSMWWHAWEPKQSGEYQITLRCSDPSVRSQRLDEGYYGRRVKVDAV